MNLRITSPDELIFKGTVEKLTCPTDSWELWILKWHTPISSVVRPWLVKITLHKENRDEILKQKKYLLEEWDICLSVSKGLLFVDGENVMIVTSAATTTPSQSKEILLKMKEDLQKEVDRLKSKWSIEDLEKALIELQKVTADLKLFKLK